MRRYPRIRPTGRQIGANPRQGHPDGRIYKPAALDLTDIVFREKTITGSMSGYGMYDKTIRIMANPLFRPDVLITERIGLEHLVDTGYRGLLEDKDPHIKTLVQPAG